MKPEDPAPLKNAINRTALKARYWQQFTGGTDDELHALAIDPEYLNAMAYLNLLLRHRADLAEADAWMQKALEAQKKATAVPK
jgi:hypothetical protein